MEYYSAIKKNEILPFTTVWMDLEGRYNTKWNKLDKEKQIPYDFIYMWHVKNKINERTK